MAEQRDPKQYAREIEIAVQDALVNIAQNVGDAIDQAMGNINGVSTYTLRDIKKGFADLSKVNTVLAKASVDATQGEFNRAKATKILLDRKAKQRALEDSVVILQRALNDLTQEELEANEELVKDLKEQETQLKIIKGLNKDIEKSLDTQVIASTNINKAQGLSGALLGSLAKLSSKAGLGGLTDVFQDAKAASTELASKLTQGGAKSVGFLGKSRVAAKGLGIAMRGVAGYLAGPVGIVMLLGKAVKFLLAADQRAAATAEALNMTKLQAAEFNKNILRAATNIDYLNNRLGAATELASSFANNTGIIATNLEVFNADLDIISRRFGLTAQQTAEIAKNMIIAGQGSTEFAVNALGAAEALEMQSGINLQNQAIMKDIADLTATQYLNLNGQPDAIARAVTQARRFGMTMSLLEGTQSSLLNFSQSITDELNAELLLGRQLNLDRARLAALDNDYATVAAEVASQIGSAAEFSEMNYFQQQALAKAVGMTRDELAKSLKEQEALEKAGFASADAREEEYQKLKKIYGQQEALRRIGMKEFTVMKTNISFQEKLNNLLHNMKIIFMDSINPLLQKATTFLQKNPDFIKKMVDKVKEVAIAVTDFVEQLWNGGPAIDNLAKKFEKFGFITDMFKEFATDDQIKEQIAAITDEQLKAIGQTREEYGRILRMANQEQGAFKIGAGTMLITNEAIRERREQVKEFNRILKEKFPDQDKASSADQTKEATQAASAAAKAAAAGADVAEQTKKATQAASVFTQAYGTGFTNMAEQIQKDAQGNYVDEAGRVYPNETKDGASTTQLVDKDGKPYTLDNKQEVKQDVNVSILPSKDPETYKKDEFKPKIDPKDPNGKTNMLLEKLIYTVERGGHVYLDGRKVGEALVIMNTRQ